MNVASASGVSLGRPPVIGALTLRDGMRAPRGYRRGNRSHDRRRPPAGPRPPETADTSGTPDAVEALLRQFRPAIVRYCRARLARSRIRTGSLDEDDVAQEVCLALLSALPSYRDMGRPFGAFVLAIAAHKVADAARGAARAPCWLTCPPPSGGCSCSGWWVGCPPRTPGTYSTCHRARSGWPSTGPWSGSGRWPSMKLAAMKLAAIKLAAHESRTAELGALGPGHPRSQ